MPDYKKIYNSQNKKYDILISHEDYQGNLKKALLQIANFDNKTVVEFGAGTGRISFLLSKHARHIFAFDSSDHMMSFANKKTKDLNVKNISFNISDNQSLSVDSETGDISIEGWSFSHSLKMHNDEYKSHAEILIKEINRVTKPGGTMIIIETLGTNTTSPIIINDRLKYFFELLENKYDFTKKIIRTDYSFNNKKEAHKVLDFFFGKELVLIESSDKIIVPECTGIWWKIKEKGQSRKELTH